MLNEEYMNNLSFRGLRMGHPNHIVEFNWPVGKEIPSDLRRLTVNEFYLAVQLAARSVREMKEPQPPTGREQYDKLLEKLNSFLEKNSNLKEYIDMQIDEVTAEIANIQRHTVTELQPAHTEAQVEPVEHVEAEVEQVKRKPGRPKKVKF